ncbi:hypothetical protein C8J57DRAFT_1237026 [Mycena rebaudengoi]|nr:hypothetical protein C8J57DRAFT_1237026 [Mycena rebaudengoi]
MAGEGEKDGWIDGYYGDGLRNNETVLTRAAGGYTSARREVGKLSERVGVPEGDVDNAVRTSEDRGQRDTRSPRRYPAPRSSGCTLKSAFPEALARRVPTRFGTYLTQRNALWDSASGLWASGALAGMHALRVVYCQWRDGEQDPCAHYATSSTPIQLRRAFNQFTGLMIVRGGTLSSAPCPPVLLTPFLSIYPSIYFIPRASPRSLTARTGLKSLAMVLTQSLRAAGDMGNPIWWRKNFQAASQGLGSCLLGSELVSEYRSRPDISPFCATASCAVDLPMGADMNQKYIARPTASYMITNKASGDSHLRPELGKWRFARVGDGDKCKMTNVGLGTVAVPIKNVIVTGTTGIPFSVEAAADNSHVVFLQPKDAGRSKNGTLS